MFLRHGRFLYHLIHQLAIQYKFALLVGFVLGLTGSLTIVRLSPLIQQQFFAPTERVGIVGSYTPTTLPLGIQSLISTGLTTTSADGAAHPGLAQSWEATDSGKTYLFYLRTDARWHNQKPVLAADVNYNIRNVAFTPIDPHTIRATLQEPYSPFPSLVVKPIFGAGLVGFGPYRVAAIRLKGDSVQYLKLVPVANLRERAREFRFYLSESQARVAYKRGDIDAIPDLFASGELSGWGNTAVAETTRYDRVVAIFFNMKDPRLAQRGFRQGLAYGVPDLGQVQAFSPFPKSSWSQTEQVKKYPFNDAGARKLLKNADAATSSAQLTISTFFPFAAVAEAIAKSWTAVGVVTTVKIINDITEGYQVLLTSQTLPPDPDQYPLWHSTQKDTNITGYANAKIDKLLEDGRRETDVEKRKKIYADFARRLTDEVPVRFLYYPKTYTVSRRK